MTAQHSTAQHSTAQHSSEAFLAFSFVSQNNSSINFPPSCNNIRWAFLCLKKSAANISTKIMAFPTSFINVLQAAFNHILSPFRFIFGGLYLCGGNNSA